MDLKRGKLPARSGAIKLRFASFLRAAKLPPLPGTFGHSRSYPDDGWSMLGNNRCGDCVFAGAAHETMLLAREAGRTVTFSDAGVIADYGAVAGYDPRNPKSDQGTDVQEAAAYRQKTGIVDAAGERHKIEAYLALDPGNISHLYYAAYLFGAVGIGLALPDSAEQMFDAGRPWDISGPPGAGHYVPLVGLRPGMLHVITWGKRWPMTARFLPRYCDEAIAYVSRESLVNEKSPEGFDYAALCDELSDLA